MVSKKIIFFLILVVIAGIFFIAKTYIKRHSLPESVLSAQKSPDDTFVFLGDSMTEYLGNFDELRYDLKIVYPDRNILYLNYGFGSTNILNAKDRIESESTHSARIFMPINDIPFKRIFIESFGNNPLSQFPLAEGLKKQWEALDGIVASLTEKHDKSTIIFVATIAPNQEKYGEGVVQLPPEERKKWADERSAYIKNHMAYARAHNIPVIDIYDVSLNIAGTGNLIYLNKEDFIHPSPKGIYFISKEIARFLKQNKFF